MAGSGWPLIHFSLPKIVHLYFCRAVKFQLRISMGLSDDQTVWTTNAFHSKSRNGEMWGRSDSGTGPESRGVVPKGWTPSGIYQVPDARKSDCEFDRRLRLTPPSWMWDVMWLSSLTLTSAAEYLGKPMQILYYSRGIGANWYWIWILHSNTERWLRPFLYPLLPSRLLRQGGK